MNKAAILLFACFPTTLLAQDYYCVPADGDFRLITYSLNADRTLIRRDDIQQWYDVAEASDGHVVFEEWDGVGTPLTLVYMEKTERTENWVADTINSDGTQETEIRGDCFGG